MMFKPIRFKVRKREFGLMSKLVCRSFPTLTKEPIVEEPWMKARRMKAEGWLVVWKKGGRSCGRKEIDPCAVYGGIEWLKKIGT